MVENDFVVFDVLGTPFNLPKTLFENHLSSLFHNLINNVENYNLQLPVGIVRRNTNEYYVLRSPDLVKIVIYYLLKGKLHVPFGLCPEDVMEEFAFWQVQPTIFCHHCAIDYEGNKDQKDGSNSTVVVETENKSNVRRKLWSLLEKPMSSFAALVILQKSFFKLKTIPRR